MSFTGVNPISTNLNFSVYASTTIAAISTPPFPGGIGVIRVSGENAQAVCDRVFKSVSGKKISEIKGYTALFGAVYSKENEKLDDCIALNFISPHSYTGENTVELSCHGGIYIMKTVLEALFSAGAVPADRGEFTKRAFLNGKLDLTQAESVMELIEASGSGSARAALSLKDGALSKKLNSVKDDLIDLGSHLSAWADYPDDDIPQVDDNMLKERLDSAKEKLEKLLSTSESGRIIKEGVKTAIVGKPNAGKSSLMNLLSGSERSIVTSIAGTTRDIVEDDIILGGVPLHIADTAGIRDTDNIVEKIGVDLAKDRISSAELIFAVFDSSEKLSEEDISIVNEIKSSGNENVIAVINKSDLETSLDLNYVNLNFNHIVNISAKLGDGLEALTEKVTELFHTSDMDFSAGIVYNERQKNDVKLALECVNEAIDAFNLGFTLDAVTVSCEAALSYLMELTGEKASEEVVARVFEKFCVGK